MCRSPAPRRGSTRATACRTSRWGCTSRSRCNKPRARPASPYGPGGCAPGPFDFPAAARDVHRRANERRHGNRVAGLGCRARLPRRSAVRGRMIVCRTLGPVDMSVNGAGAPPALLWRKNLALLVYLARSPKRARTREHLIGLLWADKPEEDARHSLNEAVRTLRRHLGEGGLESDGNQVRLGAGAVELDTDRLEALVAGRDYEAAAALVSGEVLEGFGVRDASRLDDWIAGERAFWRARSVDALVQRVEQLLRAGRGAPARALAQRALGLARDSDRAVQAVMRCCALAGDRAGALAQFQTFAAHLTSEVGTEPADETKALAQRIRQERVWRLPPPVAAGEEVAAAPQRAPLVGRAAELERLLEAWGACRQKRCPAVVILEGDAGTGKTRLAEELMDRSRLEGAATVAVRAVEADSHEPWSGLHGIARGGLLEAPGVAGAAPPALAALRAGGAPAEPLGRTLSEVLRAVAEEHPLVVLVDDAQWLDRESLLARSEEHTSELQSLAYLVCRLLLEKKKKNETRTRLET